MMVNGFLVFPILIISFISINSINAEEFPMPLFYYSEEGSITIGQEHYLKPKYIHEPTQLTISGKIENYQRAEETRLTITSPFGSISKNKIFPTRNGDFQFHSQITRDFVTGSYEVKIFHKDMVIGPAIFQIVKELQEPRDIQKNLVIPDWIKNNARWWSQGMIGDNDFVEGIQYLINNEIMQVPPSTPGTKTGSNEIPSWVKNVAGWWGDGLIRHNDFVESIQYLIQNRIIKLA